MNFGALFGGLGCCPLVHETYLPQTDSHIQLLRHSEFGRKETRLHELFSSSSFTSVKYI